MIKNIYDPAYSENKHVFVKSMLGAKFNCMKNYPVPTTDLGPDVIVIQYKTYDLRREADLEEIVNLGL